MTKKKVQAEPGKDVFRVTVMEESTALANQIAFRLKTKGSWEGEILAKSKNSRGLSMAARDSSSPENEKAEISGHICIYSNQADSRDMQKAIEEKDIALREVLRQIEIKKKAVEARTVASIRRFIFPILKKIENKANANDSKNVVKYLRVLERNLGELTGPVGGLRTYEMNRLTLKEIEICNLIRGGLGSKEIAQMLGISPITVETHRVRIRRKLEIKSRKINLATYLQP